MATESLLLFKREVNTTVVCAVSAAGMQICFCRGSNTLKAILIVVRNALYFYCLMATEHIAKLRSD